MPIRLAILGSSPCHLCHAACCKQNGHAYAALLQDHELPRFKPFAVTATFRAADGTLRTEHVLPYVNGQCQFLGPDNLCTIYDHRPESCRAFECLPHLNQNGIGHHGPFLTRNPKVLNLLNTL